MRLHVISLPHTVNDRNRFSTCAFTMKALNLCDIASEWAHVIDYSNGESKSLAQEKVSILSEEEFKLLSQRSGDSSELYDKDIANQQLVRAFWGKALLEFKKRVQPDDFVAHIFGPRQDVQQAAPKAFHIETGIGYPAGIKKEHWTCRFRIFESATWQAFHAGGQGTQQGNNYSWVIENPQDLRVWKQPVSPTKDYVLFFGRLVGCKGLNEALEIARRTPDLEFRFVGQGGLGKRSIPANVKVLPPVQGDARPALLGNALCMLCLTVFREPFCNSATEAMLCGTPVISTPFGVFPEKIKDGEDGFMCHTLADMVVAVEECKKLDRDAIAAKARARYSFEVLGAKYLETFKQIRDLRKEGWYTPWSHKFNRKAF